MRTTDTDRAPEGVLAAALRQQRTRRRRRRRGAAGVVLLAAALVAHQQVGGGQEADADTGSQGDPVPATFAPAAGPAADGLDPELAQRFRRAQKAAARDGVSLTLTSGWRSAAEQAELVDQTIERYGDEAEAHRWVLPPETSAHVQGLAVDVGGTEGALWLGEHGYELGLCRAYANEVWHFELLPDGAQQCPEMAPDSSGGWR
ncbi:M15 family metallopeptidase [Cellulomonas sp. DKR-3]|uniref:M15 family metallopeptidase n=1 Tax=Cellulomonas fulva TaxID=2835530 RepID=A0ABS5TW10_9CELL|nr:M15 family metallopeptidase [Cellulomonas fulva]MBT0993347.1 M15 family metallopeptidase [Cellulomonas fulva]